MAWPSSFILRLIDLVGVKGAVSLDAAAPRYTLAWVNQLAGAVPVLLISLARAERVCCCSGTRPDLVPA